MPSYRLPSELPVIQAPMGGGPSTAALSIAVANAGGFAFVAGGYLTAATLAEEMNAVRAGTSAPFGVNLFVPGTPAARSDVEAYAEQLRPEAERLGAELGDGRWDSDHYEDKIDYLVSDAPHLVTFTFGCPTVDITQRLHSAGAAVGVTVTSLAEAHTASEAGADVLIVQGTEAGGHQGSFDGSTINETPLAVALEQTRDLAVPVIATGGIMTADHTSAALAAGAIAVQVGTSLLCTPEAGTSEVYRNALLNAPFDDTIVTRAYSGRYARGLRNRFAREHIDAPDAYPEVHYLTLPLRAAATAAGDADVPNLWAGTNWRAIVAAPAADIVRRLTPR
jgi:nitronate monooxygenase